MNQDRCGNLLVGAAGQYYVSYMLARAGYHVALTVGNAPCVDLLVSTVEGEKSLSLQVKTSAHATRRRNKINGKYWVIGKVLEPLPNLWYAFVDMSGDEPTVYYVPSKVVYAYSRRITKMPFFFMSDDLAKRYQTNSILFKRTVVPRGIIRNAP